MSIFVSPYLVAALIAIIVILCLALFWKRIRINLKFFWRRFVVRKIQWIIIKVFNWTLKVTGNIVKNLHSLENWMISKKKLPKTGMRDLSPTKLADKERGYSKLLKWALDNRAIKNLAISGPYGSGKSSIIQAFQLRHPEYRYLNISLATFRKAKKDQVELVLLSILQQIFYYVKGSSMPDSRYKRIHPIAKRKLFLRSAILVIWAVCLYVVLKPDILKTFPEWTSLTVAYPKLNYIFLTIMISGGIAILYSLLKLYNNAQLNKLNIASGELEIQPKSENSILNKHLDEILYFFEISKYDVVIIEDIDRFENENTEIFTKLRELNTLINNAQQIGRHVVFVYAIRDEVFKNEDRTKFFDFILPVIPVINSSNSGDQLWRQLTEAGIAEKIDRDFVNKMSDYITDMRMLINIMNEFLMYKNTIGNFDFEHNNLLGMVIYKNIEPDDFANLQGDKGILYQFIHNRQTYNDPLTTSLNAQYIALQKEINDIEDGAIASVQELRWIYLFALFNRLPSSAVGSVEFGGTYLALKELASDNNFKLVREAKKISYQFASAGVYGLQTKTVNYAFSEVEDEVAHEHNYDHREKLITIKAENRLEAKKKELEQLQNQISRIRFAKIKELSSINRLEIINPTIAEKQLLIYLLEKGYIDEQYRNYISYFYAESMTSADRDFIMGVNYNREMDITFKLKKTDQVIKNLSLEDFSKPQIINITLLDYLLTDMETYSEELSRIFAQISSINDEAKKVRERYRKEGAQKLNFMFQLTKSWPKFWEYIQLESNYTAELKLSYLEDILNAAADEDILTQNNQDLLSIFLSEMEDFQEFSKKLPNQAKTDKLLKDLGVKFSRLGTAEDEHLFNLILQENLYEINPHMISLLIGYSAKKRNKPLDELETAQYTFLRQFGDDKILNYVHQHIENYVANVLLKLESNTEESESSVLAILNNSLVTEEVKKQFIKSQNIRIQVLKSVVETSLWETIVSESKMIPNWKNISEYQQDLDQIDEALAGYLNLEANYTILENESFTDGTDIKDTDLQPYYDELITSELISDMAMEHLIKSIPYTFEQIDLTGISDDRVDLLLKNDFLKMNQENYDLLKASHNGKNIKFLEGYYGTEFEWWSELTFDANDYLLLYASTVFPLSYKLGIAQRMPLEILQQDSKVAHLLSGLFALSSLPAPDLLFNEVITYASDVELKVQMMLQQEDHFSAERYQEVLRLMGQPYQSILEETKYASLPNEPYNGLLALVLKTKGLISSITGQNKQNLRLNMYQKEK